MPRKNRVYVPEMPYHIVQRGNNREACFYCDDDYQLYLELLGDYSDRYKVSVHAYILMTNHIHLLVTPAYADSVSRMMQSLASRYAFFMNKLHKRSGTVWEGRHKSSVVDAADYLLKCYRYIELNPVRANMVSRPEEYRWSSYGVNAWGDKSNYLSHHSEYLNLGTDSEERCLAYRELFRHQLDKNDLHAIRQAAYYSHPLGDSRFVEQIERYSGKAVGYAKRGRPKKVIF